MPEGHTIHRVARDHRRCFVGQPLAALSPQGRFQDGARRLHGRTLVAVHAHGKHLFYQWEGGLNLHIHLGLYGKFRLHRSPPPEPQGAVRLRIIGEAQAFDLHGPTACELISKKKHRELLARIGQDPLRRDADPGRAWQRVQRSRSAVGTLLLDQSIFAGVGNVYRAEVLFATRIHPERPGCTLSQEDFDGIWSQLVSWMKVGLKYNRIITAPPNGKTPG